MANEGGFAHRTIRGSNSPFKHNSDRKEVRTIYQ